MKRTQNTTRMTVWGAGAAVALAGSAIASPPSADQVSEHAKVMMHVDLEALNASKMGNMILEQIEADSNNFEEMQQIFPGFTLRPEGGLRGITAYAGGVGHDGPENMVMLVHGDRHLKNWEEGLAEMLAENGGDIIDIDGHSTLVVPMDEETGYLSLVKNGGNDFTWVFGQNVLSLSEGLEVLAGESAAVQGVARERIGRKWKDGTIAMFGTARLEVFEDMEPASAILNLANEVWGRIGEDEGEFFAELTVHSEDQKKVNQMMTVYNGAIALGSILAQESEELSEVMAMAQTFKVWAKDGYLTLAFEHDAEKLMELIEEQTQDSWDYDIEVEDDDGWDDEEEHDDEI